MSVWNRIRTSLELFEVVGIVASLAAAWIYFSQGDALDRLVGQPRYHTHMLVVVAGIYAHFIPWAILVGTLILLFSAIWVRRAKTNIWARYGFGLRVFLAYCLLLIVFRVVNFYVPVLHPGIRDAVIQKMDATLLGGKQMADWLAPLAHRWLTDILTGAYVSWFWLIFMTLLILLWKDKDAVTEYVLASLIAFYMGYISYILVPVIGPGYTLPHMVKLGDIAPTFQTNTLLIARDCFPSLHTAISVMMVIYVWRTERRFLFLYVPLAVLIILATLYLRFHYLADDITGAALAFVIAQAAPVLHRRWKST